MEKTTKMTSLKKSIFYLQKTIRSNEDKVTEESLGGLYMALEILSEIEMSDTII